MHPAFPAQKYTQPSLINNSILNPNAAFLKCNNQNYANASIQVIDYDRRVTAVVGDMIPTFIELAEKYEDIDRITAQALREKFVHIFPELQTDELPSPKQMRKLYDCLHSQILQVRSLAEQKGKKALILAAASEHDRKSLLFLLMIIHIASKLEIHDLASDKDSGLVSDWYEQPLDSILSPNFAFVLKLAQKYGFYVGSKGGNTSTASANAEDTHCLCIVDVKHLRGFCKDPELLEKYELLNINASNVTEEKVKSLSNKFKHALDSKNALQLKIDGNPYSLNFKNMKKFLNVVRFEKKSADYTSKGKQKRFSSPTAIDLGIDEGQRFEQLKRFFQESSRTAKL